ncbi:MAG: TlpA family protein disulfide reductase [Chitinophagaceae bacterium]|nr:TlpA family protein disulfide reductase [Rubrivivax sp.]
MGYTLLDGTRGSMGALRGKVVLVNFWATSCAPCIRHMPSLVTLHKTFRTRAFDILAVAMRYDAPARVADFAESRQLPFGVVIDNTGALAAGFGGVQVTPTHVLVDRRGILAGRWAGRPDFGALHARVEQLLRAA